MILLPLCASCVHGAPSLDAPLPGRTPVEALAPQPQDVGSVEGIMRAFYEVVNVGPAEPRQWGRDRTLYSPWIRFVAIGKSPSRAHPEVEIWTQTGKPAPGFDAHFCSVPSAGTAGTAGTKAHPAAGLDRRPQRSRRIAHGDWLPRGRAARLRGGLCLFLGRLFAGR